MLVIFTDLDGTLLESRSYSWAAALPALRRCQRLQVPLVFCSSKTRAEISYWRRLLGNAHPFISENGGGIFAPAGYFAAMASLPQVDGFSAFALGEPYQKLRDEFIRLRERLGIAVRGFGDMDDDELNVLTGLPLQQARLARRRDFSEPFVFMEDPDARFLKAIEASGRHWTRGRLYHMMGDHDKGRAVRMVWKFYAEGGAAPISAGLGDGFNDLPMLRAVDRPILVRQPDGSFDAQVDFPGLARTHGVGPAGWNEAVMTLLDETGTDASGTVGGGKK
jgi:mannosyl-3-phosphoglycerate phosphatase